ncbi:MAG: hypothetical protein EXS16_18320 [Gemmataceae bacterium]|nr:hypothetical protein [Gemmataceae bacterium]
MHRLHFVPRLVVCGSLLVILSLDIDTLSAQAQDLFQANRIQLPEVSGGGGGGGPGAKGGPEIKQELPYVIMTVGSTQTYQLLNKEKLKKVENQFAKVLMVRPIEKDFTSVLFEAVGPGRTHVRITGESGRVEEVDVVVVSDRVKELRDLIQRNVPASSVQVNSSDSGNTIVLTGTVGSAEDARIIGQLAASVSQKKSKEDKDDIVNNIRIGGVQTVSLEVIVAVVNRSHARNMTFSWSQNGSNWMVSSLLGSPFSAANSLATAVAGSSFSQSQGGTANIPFGVLNSSNSFLGFLQALRTEGLAKIIAEPRVTTLSGRPAFIISGGETPIILSGGVASPPSISYKQFGTVVHCLPTVLGNGKIHLEVRPELSQLDSAAGVSVSGTIAPGFKTRSVQAAVQMEDGQTLAIGGLIQSTTNATITRVPFLGDLPFVGTAFTSKSYAEVEEELVILVTARLADPIDCTKIPRFLPGRETRRPDDFEFFLEGILEAPRGQRNVLFHPHYYKPAFHGASNIGQIPCGPNGCAPEASSGGNASQPRPTSSANSAVSMPVMTTMPVVTTTPEVQPSPTPKVQMPNDSTLPDISSFPSIRDISSSLGPVTPVVPTIPVRETETSPTLPPIGGTLLPR